MIAATEPESPALANERSPLLCSPPIAGTSTVSNSDGLNPLGLPENDVACAKSGIGRSSDGFKGVLAVMLLGSFESAKLHV